MAPKLTRQLVEVLGSFANADDAEFRRDVVVLVRRYLHTSGFDVPVARRRMEHCLAIVHACAEHRDPPEALLALVEACWDQAPYDPQLAALEAITRPYLPRVLPVSLMRRIDSALVHIAGIVSMADARMLWLRVRERGNFFDIDDADNLSQVFERLNRQRESDAVDPARSIVLLLSEVAAFLRRSKAEQHVATFAALATTVASACGVSDRGRAVRLRLCDLVQIKIDELQVPGTSEFRYTLSMSFYRRSAHGLVCVDNLDAGGDCTLEELPNRGSELLTAFRAFAQGQGFRVEFLLPYSLLSMPTRLWTVASDERLEHYCRVVVRSLDRMVNSWMHGDWPERWQRFREGDARGFGWIADGSMDSSATTGLADVCTPKSPHALRRWLDDAPHIVAVAVAGAPLSAGKETAEPFRDEIVTTVKQGIPIMLWRRDGGDSTELVRWHAVDKHRGLDELAEQVRLLRRSADDADDADFGHHITVLWDDYDCLPPHLFAPFSSPLQSPLQGPSEVYG